ncbi:flagellar hook protein FlgE [Gammaproteobacteria bacterium 45_16_T64]|nr:flagellar hook protein FlgE [Gammaproteobacteria bacterium 45_16_T64]
MSFNTALSGLNAAQSELEVTSNNIANVSTTGFKESRAEFGDIYASSAFGSGSTSIGNGTLLQAVTQQFTQGNMDFTSNTLDLAISGDGFFVLAPNQGSSERVYTRSGAFGVDSSGNVVNTAGQLLQVFPVNANDGTVQSTSLSSTENLRLPESAGVPQQTASVSLGVNLPSDSGALPVGGFDPSDNTTYNASTSVNVFDSQGESHVATVYYVKDSTAASGNVWHVFHYIDNEAVDIAGGDNTGQTANATLPLAGVIEFEANGLFNPATGGVVVNPILPAGGMTTVALGVTGANLTEWQAGVDGTQAITFDYDRTNTTQFASSFTVNTLSQDGFAIGRLTGLDVSDTGVIRATYTNGQTTAVGKVAMARFPNNQGLSQNGNTSWTQTTDSGEALPGESGTGTYGLIRSGALEQSNVDLTAELVGLITAQRNFQANAKSIETANAITQAIIQIR